MPGKTKVLTVCQGGNSRSVALGFLLKYKYGCDAIACGWEGNNPETVEMLCRWADNVIVLQSAFTEKIPPEFHHKLAIFDVGEDRWCNSLHPELLGILDKMIIESQKPPETGQLGAETQPKTESQTGE